MRNCMNQKKYWYIKGRSFTTPTPQWIMRAERLMARQASRRVGESSDPETEKYHLDNYVEYLNMSTFGYPRPDAEIKELEDLSDRMFDLRYEMRQFP